MSIVEVKRHLDGREERFVCDVLELVPGERAVVLWRTELSRPLEDGPLRIPPGPLITKGYFWVDRSYLVYEMRRGGPDPDPDGGASGPLWGHRFDVCTDVSITPQEIRYLDLIVDVWVDARGRFFVLDEDELRRAKARGLLRPEHERLIEATLEELRARYPALLAELAGPGGERGPVM